MILVESQLLKGVSHENFLLGWLRGPEILELFPRARKVNPNDGNLEVSYLWWLRGKESVLTCPYGPRVEVSDRPTKWNSV